MYNNLSNLKINNKKIVSLLKVIFKRKGKEYKKDIYFIMSDLMENNITKKIIYNISWKLHIMQLNQILINLNC